MAEHEVRWGGRDKFAEVAEALGLTTDCIMAVRDVNEGMTVMYTNEPSAEPDEPIYAANLVRDADDVLIVQARTQIGTTADITERIEQQLRERFGDPPGR